MREWWDGLTLIGQIFAAIAIPATVIMLLQSILLLFGLGFGGDSNGDGFHDFGHDHGFDHGHDHDAGDHDGLSLITVRGMVAFFSIGGWTGLACVTGGMRSVVAVVVSFVAGSAALLGIALLFKYSLKLQDTGNLDIRNALGKTGTVYLPVPARREGMGKVTVLFQQRWVELEALSDENRILKTGELVVVRDVIGENTVLISASDSHASQDENDQEERGGISKWIR